MKWSSTARYRKQEYCKNKKTANISFIWLCYQKYVEIIAQAGHMPHEKHLENRRYKHHFPIMKAML